ncbi:MAG: ABC transporter ATP-binding protein [Peptococcaceae bacterium]|jgi:peptide/nickel transport system ATP-binding protein|nr:ABC transporter ATP-binding protein [Peptococcaceae bacterium]
MSMLEINNLSLEIKIGGRDYNALDGISFSLDHGEIVGIAGESGAGKSLTAHSIMGLLPAGARVSAGEVLLEGRKISGLSEAELCSIRGKELSVIFQEPMTALNPLITVGNQVGEAFLQHHKRSRSEAYQRVLGIMADTGLSRPESLYHEYPHRLSGGMRQRIAIAMAMVNKPKALIADEPTSALDVTIQCQILEMIRSLSSEQGSAVLLISHDISVLRTICSRMMILYAGQIVEEGAAGDILNDPLHPYTRGLMESIPNQGKKGALLHSIPGSAMPLTRRSHAGCAFASRCAYVSPACGEDRPGMITTGGRHVRCFMYR